MSNKGKIARLTRQEVFEQVSGLLDQANASAKPVPNSRGMAKHLKEGEHLTVELLFRKDEVHVSIFSATGILHHQVQEGSLDLNIEASTSEVKRFENYPGWGASAIFKSISAEQWPEVKFRLLPAE